MKQFEAAYFYLNIVGFFIFGLKMNKDLLCHKTRTNAFLPLLLFG